MELFASTEVRLLVALALGLLVGIERERRMFEQGERQPAGARTFGLVALLGGVLAAYFPAIAIGLGGVFIGAAALVGYSRTAFTDRGVTTEVAMVLVYALGALAIRRPAVASGLSMLVTLVLAERRRLHTLATETLSHDELLDVAFLGVAALVVLPLVPNRMIGPFGGVNLFTVWRLVVVVMTLSALGYVGQRIAGPKYGLPIAGFASGFVSATATIASMSAHVRRKPSLEAAAVAGASFSGVATVLQLGVVVFTASPPAAVALSIPLAAALAFALGYALLCTRVASRAPEQEPMRGRMVNLKAALGFSALVGVVSLLSRVLHHRFGASGLFLAAGVAALVDAHAAAGSVAAAHAAGTASGIATTSAILVAFSVNALSKIIVAFASGPRRYAIRVGAGVALAVLAAWVGQLVSAIR
ncbi:MAG: MgtC/SapB family protein [Polyangiales bacterium]